MAARKFPVCFVDELPAGGRKIVEVDGRSIGVFNVGNTFYAVRNRCPHKGAPLCRGMIKGLAVADAPYQVDFVRDGEILKCPWHGWEFDLTNGRSVFNPHRLRVKSYDVSVEPPSPDCWTHVTGSPDDDPSIETFAVSIEHQDGQERARIFVHLT